MIDINGVKNPQEQISITLDKWKWIYIFAVLREIKASFREPSYRAQCQEIIAELEGKYLREPLEKALAQGLKEDLEKILKDP